MARSRAAGVCGGLLLVTLGVSAACGAASASPAAPTSASAPAPLLTVTGADAPASAGQTIHLAASLKSNGSASDVTATAAWQSSDERVAKVSPAGLVTTVALGTATLSATYQGQSASQRVFVTIGSGVIASCVGLTGSGSFTLASDLPAVASPCVTFTTSVSSTFDCQGHDASGVALGNVQGFTIQNCLMHGALDNGSVYLNLFVTASSSVSVQHVDVLGTALISACTSCALTDSAFAYPGAGHASSGTEVHLVHGHDNQLLRNTIDGGWDGNLATYGHQGCDDALLIDDEASLLVQDNVIRHAWDSGIEAVGSLPLSAAAIRGNTISFMGFTGIGGWYLPGFQDSVMSGNTVTDSPTLMYLFVDSLGAKSRGYHFNDFVFLNNQFFGNVLLRPVPAPGGQVFPSAIIDLENRLPGHSDNNLVRDNNFGTASPGPSLFPQLAFVDGGGNVCRPVETLTCVGGESIRR